MQPKASAIPNNSAQILEATASQISALLVLDSFITLRRTLSDVLKPISPLLYLLSNDIRIWLVVDRSIVEF
jgi:hypothetical protein